MDEAPGNADYERASDRIGKIGNDRAWRLSGRGPLEADVLGQVDNWLRTKFAPASLDATLAELQSRPPPSSRTPAPRPGRPGPGSPTATADCPVPADRAEIYTQLGLTLKYRAPWAKGSCPRGTRNLRTRRRLRWPPAGGEFRNPKGDAARPPIRNLHGPLSPSDQGRGRLRRQAGHLSPEVNQFSETR